MWWRDALHFWKSSQISEEGVQQGSVIILWANNDPFNQGRNCFHHVITALDFIKIALFKHLFHLVINCSCNDISFQNIAKIPSSLTWINRHVTFFGPSTLRSDCIDIVVKTNPPWLLVVKLSKEHDRKHIKSLKFYFPNSSLYNCQLWERGSNYVNEWTMVYNTMSKLICIFKKSNKNKRAQYKT